ncbi:HAMP domain-containing histidine kinase [Sulfurimonas sp. MAG313]|nr:HAMP domain-containing histidine kinase [Sulfurimonas sp. MAG313]
MKKVEVESFFKSFFLFFSSILLLMLVIFYFDYKKELNTLDESLLNKMRVCSFDLKCKDLGLDFSKSEGLDFYTLQKDNNGVHANFPILGSKLNALTFSLSKEAYSSEVKRIENELLMYFSLVSIGVVLLSFLFSMYTLSPLRNALHLTEEFIKDILHDFNTPLSTLRLNTSMLEAEFGENSKISRIQKSVQNILDLQENLRVYLSGHAHQKQEIDLKMVVQERITFFEKNNPQIQFKSSLSKEMVHLNSFAFIRIIDNLLSNAVKYNRNNADIELIYQSKDKKLLIKDSGKGISNVNKVFERFYKEQDRGLGIGLHIVKKLCDDLGIKISVQSELGVGSVFYLDLSALT